MCLKYHSCNIKIYNFQTSISAVFEQFSHILATVIQLSVTDFKWVCIKTFSETLRNVLFKQWADTFKMNLCTVSSLQIYNIFWWASIIICYVFALNHCLPDVDNESVKEDELNKSSSGSLRNIVHIDSSQSKEGRVFMKMKPETF